MVPLLPFFFIGSEAVEASAAMTSGVFFAIGAMKSHWAPAPWWPSGPETPAIGGTAAFIAYAVGSLFEV